MGSNWLTVGAHTHADECRVSDWKSGTAYLAEKDYLGFFGLAGFDLKYDATTSALLRWSRRGI